MTASSVPHSTTSISQRFITFLKVKPGEERLIGLLVLLYFILALGFVFVQSMAFGIFLAEYGAQGLPYSYISIAIVASLVAAYYIKLGGRVSFSTLLTINLTFLACVSLLIWLALNSPMYHITAFILPLWFQIVVNLGNLAVSNADIIAEQPVSLLMIPKEVYLRYWYEPYSPMEIKNILADEGGKDA